jgi:hypothetical protein
LRYGDDLMELSSLIVGSWANMDANGMTYGVTRDDYHSNGTKNIEIAIHKSGEQALFRATAKWQIVKNILTEEITEIDKKAVKAFGFKKGFTTRAYIQSLNDEHLIVKQLNTGGRHLVGPVTLTRVDR